MHNTLLQSGPGLLSVIEIDVCKVCQYLKQEKKNRNVTLTDISGKLDSLALVFLFNIQQLVFEKLL